MPGWTTDRWRAITGRHSAAASSINTAKGAASYAAAVSIGVTWQLYPPEIEFYAIEPEILHVVRIVATNLDSVPHRIRVTHPKVRWCHTATQMLSVLGVFVVADQRISTDR